jgi:hypothetical protein
VGAGFGAFSVVNAGSGSSVMLVFNWIGHGCFVACDRAFRTPEVL